MEKFHSTNPWITCWTETITEYVQLFFLLLIVLCSTHTETGITHSSDIILLNYPRFTVNLCMCVLCRSDSDTLKCKIVFSFWLSIHKMLLQSTHTLRLNRHTCTQTISYIFNFVRCVVGECLPIESIVYWQGNKFIILFLY